MNLPGGWELVLILLVVVVVFGSKRLPDASRSLGRSLRIFKAETKGLRDDEPERESYDSRRHDRESYERIVQAPPYGPQQGAAPAQQGYPQQPSYDQQLGRPQPLPAAPPVPGVAPAPGSVPPPDEQRSA